MKLARSAVPLAFAAALVVPHEATPAPILTVEVLPQTVAIHLENRTAPFFGGVIASLSPQLRHFLVDLPPLLDNAAVLGVGLVDYRFDVTIPVRVIPPGLFIYVQGVVLGDEITATDVKSFVLDAQNDP
ncbi:MAG: hypothetical protein H6838_15490 [Planctomycetes bacterium]|nr:hypothetical protein [Planctomycetota bacterium]MCB9886894.1 hypothetical protein [Planctomycetota bacterium]